MALCLLRDEIQKIPLRHQGNKPAMRGQMLEIGDL
jgi:hypothetical protein